jgi:hypothetical protein
MLTQTAATGALLACQRILVLWRQVDTAFLMLAHPFLSGLVATRRRFYS